VQSKTKRGDRAFGIVLFIIVVSIALGSVWYGSMPAGQQTQQNTITPNGLPSGDPTLTTCISGKPIVLRMKINLRIVLSGTQIKIPAGIGVTPECTRPLRTIDNSGAVYVESPVPYAFTLADFFAVWKQPFNRNQIFFLQAGVAHKINMTVNGLPSSEFENHILQDGEQIVISYV
jgi:hypothetical protein